MREVARFPAHELAEGALRRLFDPPFDVVVLRSGGKVFALRDACPHSGHSLSEGHVTDCVLTCPMHGWEIDVRTGQVLTAAGKGEQAVALQVTREGSDLVIWSTDPANRKTNQPADERD